MTDQNKNIYQSAILAIQSAAKIYNLKIFIEYRASIWRIKIMDKKFNNKDFLIACKDAIQFAYNAHNPNDIIKDDE